MVDTMADADPNVRGPVSVRIVDRTGDPLPGMRVVFIDTDNTLTDLVSDATGTASADVYPNASVTAIRERAGGIAYQLTTLLALNPGDNITLIAAPGVVTSADDTFTQGVVPLPAEYVSLASKQGSTGTFTTRSPHGLVTGDTVVVSDSLPEVAYNGTWIVTGTPSTTMFTANIGSGGAANATAGTAAKAELFTVSYPAYAGAQSYAIYSPCGPTDAGTATSATIRLRAGCSTTTMDLVVVARAAGGAVIAWTQATGVAFAANGSTTLSGAWQAPSAITATYTNPTGVTGIELRRFAPYIRPPATSGIGTGIGPLTVTAPTPARAAMQSTVSCTGGTCVSDTAQQVITQLVDGTATAYTLDVAANLLPWLTATWMPTTTTMEMTVTGTSSYDLFHAYMVYTPDSINQTIYTWRVFGPTAGTFKFPTLPSTVPGNPTLTASSKQATYSVDVCESDAVGGYRVAIKNPYGALGTYQSTPSPNIIQFNSTMNRISSN